MLYKKSKYLSLSLILSVGSYSYPYAAELTNSRKETFGGFSKGFLNRQSPIKKEKSPSTSQSLGSLNSTAQLEKVDKKPEKKAAVHNSYSANYSVTPVPPFKEGSDRGGYFESLLSSYHSDLPIPYNGYYSVKSLSPLLITPGLKVLDVGAGNGKFTEFLQKKAGKGNVYALEPDVNDCKELSKRLESTFIKNCTLQEALKKSPEEYLQKFDFVTVLKYCIPGWEKKDFLAELSKTIVDSGVVYITVVESIYLKPDMEYPYVIGILNTVFKSVGVYYHTDRFGCIEYALVTCKHPTKR